MLVVTALAINPDAVTDKPSEQISTLFVSMVNCRVLVGCGIQIFSRPCLNSVYKGKRKSLFALPVSKEDGKFSEKLFLYESLDCLVVSFERDFP